MPYWIFHFFRYISLRFVSIGFVSFGLVSFCLISFGFVWFRFFSFVSFRFYFVSHFTDTQQKYQVLRIGECPSNSPFLKYNGAGAPKGPMPIVFKEWRDTRTFSNLKSTHYTLLIVLIINLVTKKSLCILSKV